MANRSYLCRSPWRRVDPSEAEGYDADVHTVASSAKRIPLLWLAAFRPTDVRPDGLFCATKKALVQLRARIPALDVMFGKRGSLASHVAALEAEIQRSEGTYLAIELDEIADLWTRRSSFEALLRAALGDEQNAKRALSKLSQLEGRDPFPPAIAPMRKRAEEAVIASLLGASHSRPVAWEVEREPAPARSSSPGAALFDALFSGDAELARSLLREGADPNRGGLHQSCWSAFWYRRVPVSMLDELVAAGGDLNRKHRRDGYPLVQAAWTGDVELMRAMLRLGADPHVVFRERTALDIAARMGHVDAVALLLTAGPTADEIRRAIKNARKPIDGEHKGAAAMPMLEGALRSSS